MKQSMDNMEQHLMERKQKLILRLKAAVALGREDLLKELSREFQAMAVEECLLSSKK